MTFQFHAIQNISVSNDPSTNLKRIEIDILNLSGFVNGGGAKCKA